MVGQVAAEKANVNGLLEDGIEDFLGMVAEITGATYPCKYGGGTHQLLQQKESCRLLESQWGRTEHQEDGLHLVFCWTGNL